MVFILFGFKLKYTKHSKQNRIEVAFLKVSLVSSFIYTVCLYYLLNSLFS